MISDIFDVIEDIGINENNIRKDNISQGNRYKSYEYFGNCINTVPKIWNPTQMANVIYDSILLNDKNLLSKLRNGDKKIPIKLQKELSKNDFICGVNMYQRIMFIYVINQDIHYFFDANDILPRGNNSLE